MHKYSAVRVILLYLSITAVWAGYRYFFVQPEWVDEFIAKPLIDLLPILFVVFTVEKNTLESIAITKNKFWTYVLVGVGLGILLLSESVVTRLFKNGSVQILTWTPWALILNILVAFATALVEEVVFRGYFFRRIMWIWDNEITANVLSSVFFTAAHVPLAIFSLHYSGPMLLAYCAQIYVMGTIFAFVFARVESVVPTTVAHTLWNLVNVFIK